MKQEFLDKLNNWYSSGLQRHEIINETEDDILLFVAYRDTYKILRFDITRIFMIGNSIEISVDESINASNGLNMDSILKLIKTTIRVIK